MSRPAAGERTDLANTSVQPFAWMSANQQLLHCEKRHGATGLRSQASWSEWHRSAHSAELAHEHSEGGNAPESAASDGLGCPRVPKRPEIASDSPCYGVQDPRSDGDTTEPPRPIPAARFRPPVAPSEEQKAAAWSCDLRNPDYVNSSRGTTVIVNEQDYWGDGFEMT
jgi:hypothetical protein